MSGCRTRISATTASISARYARSCTPCRRPGSSTCRARSTHPSGSTSWTRGRYRLARLPPTPTALPLRELTKRARRQQDHGSAIPAGRRNHRCLGGRQSRSGHRTRAFPSNRHPAHDPGGVTRRPDRLAGIRRSARDPSRPPRSGLAHPRQDGPGRTRRVAVPPATPAPPPHRLQSPGRPRDFPSLPRCDTVHLYTMDGVRCPARPAASRARPA